jgi:hypothetical protein
VGLPALGKKVWVALTLATWPLLVHANIGDTVDQLRQHYGSAQKLGGQMLFDVRLANGRIVPSRGAENGADRFSIAVYFDGIHSAMEVFTRNTSDPAKAELSPDDISAILNALGNGIPWAPTAVEDGKQTWLWGDSKDAPPKLLARFDPNKTGNADDASVLVIMLYTKK